MLKDIIGGIWRRAPRVLRRLTTRATQTQFTVTAAAIVVDEDRRVLLLKHRFRPGIGWGIPGGFLKANEQPEAAVRRELREEVGLELKDLHLLATHSFERLKQIEIVFRCRPHGGALPRSIEISRADWFSWRTLPEGLSDDQRRLIKVALQDGTKPAD